MHVGLGILSIFSLKFCVCIKTHYFFLSLVVIFFLRRKQEKKMRNMIVLSTICIVCIALLAGGANAQKCAEERKAKEDNPLIGQYVPSCEEDTGDYQKLQFNGATGYRFCVDPKTGETIEGTEIPPGVERVLDC